jgi:hypothetical protein
MKRPMSKKALLKEATFWNDLKKVMKESPGRLCHK